jgi:hypothetical protein
VLAHSELSLPSRWLFPSVEEKQAIEEADSTEIALHDCVPYMGS